MTVGARRIAAPKWRRLPEERPHQIIDAAIAVFGERGLYGARLEDVARRAGVSKGTIYLYFPNKVALFQEMIRQTIVAQIDETERAMAEHPGTAREQIDAYIRDWWTFMRSERMQTVQRLIIAELHRFPEISHFYADEVVNRKSQLVTRLVARGIAAGEFRDTDPAVASRMLAATMSCHGLWCGMRDFIPTLQSLSDDTVLDQVRDFFFHAIACGVPTPSHTQ
jgi:AcrR family transcriptional regulator